MTYCFVRSNSLDKMDRNYAEDQANEVEALESIYCDDIDGEVCVNNISIQFQKGWKKQSIHYIF